MGHGQGGGGQGRHRVEKRPGQDYIQIQVVEVVACTQPLRKTSIEVWWHTLATWLEFNYPAVEADIAHCLGDYGPLWITCVCEVLRSNDISVSVDILGF